MVNMPVITTISSVVSTGTRMTTIARTENPEVYRYYFSSYCDCYSYSGEGPHLKSYVRFPNFFVSVSRRLLRYTPEFTPYRFELAHAYKKMLTLVNQTPQE